MIKEVNFHIDKLDTMKKYPKSIHYIGNLDLLNKRTISIVGTRKPNNYTKQYTHELAKALTKHNICVVSGAAMGVDAIAHNAATPQNTIAVAGTGLDIRYPAVNKKLIEDIENNGLMLSQFPIKTPSQRYNFPIRNELVVSLGECLIVAQADENSGTMRSVEFALKMNKPIFVLAHRIGESVGTNKLLEQNLATAIYDIDKFIEDFVGFKNEIKHSDDFLEYCKTTPTYDDVMQKFPEKIFEYELSGKIQVTNGLVFVV
ncbi:DNA-processing protein DprA [Arcobacter sp. 15-2]|uniref:DNA-processing protein DprA n=1 Tax=Arcobacter sp. 15-2 TaxID=3374109 RepID=UPI00399CB30D